MPSLLNEFTTDGLNIETFAATGVVGETTYDVDALAKMRVVVEAVDGGNIVTVKGRIRGAAAFDTLGTVTGAVSGQFTIDDYDTVQFDCTTFAATPGPGKLIVSAF